MNLCWLGREHSKWSILGNFEDFYIFIYFYILKSDISGLKADDYWKDDSTLFPIIFKQLIFKSNFQ